MIPFWTLPSFLFLWSVGYVESCTAVTGCEIIASTSKSLEGYASLEELQCAMDAEFDAIKSGEPIRGPPYEYMLCPDVNYSWEQPLIPRLNGTKILCASGESCLVAAQIQLSHSDIDLTFQDLTFNGEGSSTSVVASAPKGSNATFVNCKWKNQPNVIAILNDEALVSLDSSGSPYLMHVNLLNCIIEDFDPSTDEKETFGVRSFGGSLTIRNLTVNNYNVSMFLDMRDGANVYIEDSTFTNSFLKDPSDFEDFIFADDSLLSFNNVVAIDNHFKNFVWLQNSALAHVVDFHHSNQFRVGSVFRLTSAMGLSLKDSELIGDAFSMILISETGPTLEVEGTIFNLTEPHHAIWSYNNVSITDSCLYGNAKESPIKLSNGSQIIYHNVFTDVQAPKEKCDGILHELVNGTEMCTEIDSTTDCRPNPTVYPPSPTCFINSREGDDVCPTVPSIGKCASTLLELRCIMCGEARAVANDAVLRSPPYIYTLCPNTTFTITDESQDTIFPILNNTQIVCGNSVTDTCIVEFGHLQVEVGAPRNEIDARAFEIFDLNHVEFHRVHFKSSQHNEDYLLTSSVWNHGRDNNLIFENCMWTDQLGSNLLVNGGASSNASNVNFIDCQIQNLSISHGETPILLSRSGELSIVNTDIVDSYLPGGLASISEDSTFRWRDSFLINCNTSSEFIILTSSLRSLGSRGETGQIAISNVLIKGNNYGESFLNIYGGGTTSIQESHFTLNQGVRTISIISSALIRPLLSISDSTFVDETLQDGLIIAVGADVEIRDCSFTNISSTRTGVEASENSKLDFSSVCFLDGSYKDSVISVDGISNLFSEEVYGDSFDYKSDCGGILYQYSEVDEFFVPITECTPIVPGQGCRLTDLPPPSRPPSPQPTMRPSSSVTQTPPPPPSMPFFTEIPTTDSIQQGRSSADVICWNW
eukprot:CAMPEP_0194216558 /NCGR_PEP_ID=MMETSP0156-20130528/19231_1 /TAXON_ID=33649 /ORGANISM="Thalassionema nitzschioides, Strain L26-B" /LENGTH=929 /DNA_ID=CAMNT_0038945359 /DNA_START=219 /DNA_END=3005 /DNA_ORIENTATION=+